MNIAEGFSFEDERFMSAAEKRLTLKAWHTFLKHGCRLEHFTDRLYHHLTQHCSFIAHYDRHGFYEVYFATPSERTQRFLDQFDPSKPGIGAESGERLWLEYPTGSDLNLAMRQVAEHYLPTLRYRFADAERHKDLLRAALLAAKHGKHLEDGADSRDGLLSQGPRAVSHSVVVTETAADQLTMFTPAE